MLTQSDRDLEFFDRAGLERLTGLDPDKGICEFIVKEFIDNSLDKSSVKRAQVDFDEKDEYAVLSISDDGEEVLSEEDIKNKLLDFKKSLSSKRGRKIIIRGILGSAFQCAIGLCALTWNCGSTPVGYNLSIKSGGKIHFIRVRKNEGSEEIEKSVRTEISDEEPTLDTTTISFILPLRLVRDETQIRKIAEIVEFTSWVNDHLTLRFKANSGTIVESICDEPLEQLGISYTEEGEEPPVTNEGVIKEDPLSKWKVGQRAGNIYCYSLEEFVKYFLECSKLAEQEKTLDFVSRFDNFRSDAKQVLKESKISDNKFLRDVEHGSIATLFQTMRRRSRKPSERELPVIGEDGFKRKLKDRFVSYKRIRGLHENKGNGVLTPWCIELVSLDKGEAHVYEFINFAYLGSKRPFTGWSYQEDINHSMNLEAEVRKKEISLLIHAVSPGFRYRDQGKGLLDTPMFYLELPKAVRAVLRAKKESSRVSQIDVLRKVIKNRIEEVTKDQSVKELNKWTQSTVFYLARKISPVTLNRKSFTQSIRIVCEEQGYRRDDLGIVAADRAQMFYRGKWSDVGLEELGHLATKGTDIIFIEKEGVAEILAPLVKEGVALVNSRGFCVEYAQDLMKSARKQGCNLCVVTDLDASGLLIALKLSGIPRIAVTVDTVSKLGVDLAQVTEEYKPPANHLTALMKSSSLDRGLLKFVMKKRIEIDTVLAESGPEKFWNYLLSEIQRICPTRDYTRAIEIDPQIVCKERYSDLLSPLLKMAEDKTRKVADKYMASKKKVTGFREVKLLEDDLKTRITRILDTDSILSGIESKVKEMMQDLAKSPN